MSSMPIHTTSAQHHHHPHIQQQSMPLSHLQQGQVPPVPANRTSTTVAVTQQLAGNTANNNNDMIIRGSENTINERSGNHQYRSSLPDNNTFLSTNNNLNAVANAAATEPIDNTSRVTISTSSSSQPSHTQLYNKQAQQLSPPTTVTGQSGEAVYEVDKRGHTSVIRVSYPGPQQEQAPIVTFPPDNEEHLQQQACGVHIAQGNNNEGILPSSQQKVSQQKQAPIPYPRSRGATATAAVVVPPIIAALPQADSQMGLDNFKFCTVLGRGHFGKV